MPSKIISEQKLSAKTKVFISYSRQDIAFADRLVEALETRGIEVKIDRRDLPLLEEWQRELLRFIRQADAVVLLVSPNSMSSPWCLWEIERIEELNKRLAPVVITPIDIEGLPEAVGKVNLVFFTPPNDFDERATALVSALNTDITWVKEHTRLGELARRWAERGQSKALLLRGAEIEEAEKWITAHPVNAPRPTVQHTDFILASRKGETRRWRTTAVAMALAFAVTAGLGLTAYLLKLQAERQRNTALTSQSRFLADRARQNSDKEDYGTALARQW